MRKFSEKYFHAHYMPQAGKYNLDAGRSIQKDGKECFVINQYEYAKPGFSHVQKDAFAHYSVDILNDVKVPKFETYFKHYMSN